MPFIYQKKESYSSETAFFFYTTLPTNSYYLTTNWFSILLGCRSFKDIISSGNLSFFTSPLNVIIPLLTPACTFLYFDITFSASSLNSSSGLIVTDEVTVILFVISFTPSIFFTAFSALFLQSSSSH